MPGDTLTAALGPIAAAQGRLDELDSKVSLAIQQLEERLRDVISTRVAIVIRLPDQDEMLLAFRKLDGAWRLTLEGHSGPVALLSAPRHLRSEVFTAGCIEQLIRAAPAQIDRQLADREVALDTAHGLIAALGGAGGKESRRG